MSGLELDFWGQFRVSFVNEIVTKLQPLNLRDYFELDKSERDLDYLIGVCWRSKGGRTPISNSLSEFF